MKKGLGCAGFNLVQNNGEAAGQTVMHFHMHVIPRYEGGPEMVTWVPGSAEQEELQNFVLPRLEPFGIWHLALLLVGSEEFPEFTRLRLPVQ